MFTFLKAFVDEFNNVGLLHWTKSTGEKISSRVLAVCGVADSPARAAFLNMKVFNGFHGCPYCYQPRVHKYGSMKYPFQKDVQKRTHADIVRDMKKATRSGQVVNGIKGLSPLVRLPGFDLTRGICPDYMHSVLGGVVKHFTETWFGVSESPAYIGISPLWLTQDC